ncbi:MAG: hypothetical protein DCC71_18920 [Proteobacteria bacterium]|nr:MAG: hypothetical protein DCC71_18920 [Pseudomonadota bacterium]
MNGAWARCDLASAAQIEQSFERGQLMPLSSYDDDPFVADATVECLPGGGFAANDDGRLVLANARVAIEDEPFIYRFDEAAGVFRRFAWNPWPRLPLSNGDGSFRYPDEPRFPLLEIERGPDGRPVLRDGAQVWKPFDLQRGATTIFEAANNVKDAVEDWSGRAVPWGVGGVLGVEAHAFYDYNAFYSPSSRMLFFGVVAYRLPDTTELRVFETATSWEIAAHEVGHALHHPLKPHADGTDFGWRTWTESFGDQAAMWTQLRDPGRVRALLAASDLGESNALSRMGEAFGVFAGTGEAQRDAVNDATVSSTPPQVHARSEVLTGAAYAFFLDLYGELSRQGRASAVEQASTILGVFLVRAADYTPENQVTLEDVGKAYLKVDAELFAGRYRDRLIDEFERREIFDAQSFGEWLAHEAALPDVRLPFGLGVRAAADVVGANLDRLGVGPDFGLRVESATRDERFRQTIVRVQLTQGRGADAVPLDDHGVLVFREDGSLADHHAAVATDGASNAEAVALLDEARRLGLHAHGAPLSIVRDAERRLRVEARVLRSDGPAVWVDAFTPDAPHGERREVVSPTWGSELQAERMAGAGVALGAGELGE